MISLQDQKWLRHALNLSKPWIQHVAPKPAVGAILVKDGNVIGRGAYKNPYGGAHAEVQALAQAGTQAYGATLYTSLEPCTWWPGKRTGSCAQTIVEAGVKRVVIGICDPHPRVNGKGITLLKKAGISVEAEPPRSRSGRLSLRIVRTYLEWVKRPRAPYHKPYVLMKTAMSLDGKIAASRGKCIILSNAADAQAVQKSRACMDAIMVGGHTLLWDEPRLTVRGKNLVAQRVQKGWPAQPIKVAIIRDARVLSIRNRFFTAGTGYRIIFTTSRTPPQKVEELKKVADVYVHKGKRVNLSRATHELYQFGIRRMMLEGGGTLNYEMLKARLVDEVRIAISPVILGNPEAPGIVNASGVGQLPTQWRLFKVGKLGTMVVVWYRVL